MYVILGELMLSRLTSSPQRHLAQSNSVRQIDLQREAPVELQLLTNLCSPKASATRACDEVAKLGVFMDPGTSHLGPCGPGTRRQRSDSPANVGNTRVPMTPMKGPCRLSSQTDPHSFTHDHACTSSSQSSNNFESHFSQSPRPAQ